MNSLSWMIYLAGVVGGLQGLLIFFAVIFAGGSLIALIAANIEYWEPGIPLAKKLVISSGVAAMIAVFIPSQTTIYAIAASEMGETVIKSETGGKAMKALNAWLDRQIKGDDEK